MPSSGLARLRRLRLSPNYYGLAALTLALVAVPLWRVADLAAYPMTGLMWAFALVCVGGVAREDPSLGLLAGYWVLRAATSPLALAFEAMFMALVCVVLLVVARYPGVTLHPILLAVASLQAGIALWQTWVGLPATGSVGNSNYLGALIAMIVPLAPVWLLPLLVAGVVVSKAAMAVLAAAAGLAYRFPKQGPALLALIGVGFLWRGFAFESWGTRLMVWQIGWRDVTADWSGILFGTGPSGWLVRIPWQQHLARVPDGIYAAAHNAYLQAFHAGGVVLLCLLAFWVWSHRAAWRDPMWGGASLAIAVSAWGFFPFQTAATAIVAVTILGVATRRLAWQPR